MFKWVGRVPAWLWFLLTAVSAVAAGQRAADLEQAEAELRGYPKAEDVRARFAAQVRNDRVRLVLNTGLTAAFVALGLGRLARLSRATVAAEPAAEADPRPPTGDQAS